MIRSGNDARRGLLGAMTCVSVLLVTMLVAAPASSADDPIPVEPVATSPDCGGEPVLKQDGTPWECTYSDDFEGTELDRDYWVPQDTATSSYRNGTADLYTCYADDDRVIEVRDGILALSLIRLDEVRDCGRGFASAYLAGSVSHWSTFSQTFGRYEVRAKLPDTRLPGSQTAFWLWPVDQFTYGPWPLSGEIDFAEFYSVYPDHVIPYLHYDRGPLDIGGARNVYTAYHCTIDYGEFNTYTLEWDPGRLTIYVNGELCLMNHYTALNAPLGQPFAPFDQPFFAALTQAMGTTGNEYDPAVMPDVLTTEVDYVYIWR